MKVKPPTTVEIRSSPTRVWEILTNFPAYPEWNPFMVLVSGKAVVGSKLKTSIKLGNSGKVMDFTPKVLVADAGKELRWVGGIPWVFTGEHSFIITDLGNGNIRWEQSEVFSGLLVPIVNCFTNLFKDTEEGFDKFDNALKARAEA